MALYEGATAMGLGLHTRFIFLALCALPVSSFLANEVLREKSNSLLLCV